jgi:hypothetical protein
MSSTQRSRRNRDPVQYGGDIFRTASAFLRRAVPGVPAGLANPDQRPVSTPAGVRATVVLLTRLPTLKVRLTGAPAGERLRTHFDDRKWGILHSRLAQGVLVLPDEHSHYLRGSSRQALRTNMRKAHSCGIRCQRLEHLDQRRAAVMHLRERATNHLSWPNELFCLAGDTWWAARDRRGTAVALAQVTIDSEWALLQSFVSTHRAARYLLHGQIVEELIAADVRYLVASAPMAPLLEPSLQYWQHLLGFRVANLSVRSSPLSAEAFEPVPRVQCDAAADVAVDQDALTPRVPDALPLPGAPALAP